MAQIDANCRERKLGPYEPEPRKTGVRNASCDILFLKPEDPLSTPEGRFAHALKLPAPHDVPKDVLRPGMTGEEYFKALCEAEAGEWVFRAVGGVEERREGGGWRMRGRTATKERRRWGRASCVSSARTWSRRGAASAVTRARGVKRGHPGPPARRAPRVRAQVIGGAPSHRIGTARRRPQAGVRTGRALETAGHPPPAHAARAPARGARSPAQVARPRPPGSSFPRRTEGREEGRQERRRAQPATLGLSLIHISEPTRPY